MLVIFCSIETMLPILQKTPLGAESSGQSPDPSNFFQGLLVILYNYTKQQKHTLCFATFLFADTKQQTVLGSVHGK